MPVKLITIATFGSPVEANLARNVLEAERIPAVLLDEATVGMAWHLGTALGGVKLQVLQEDVPRALEALREAGKSMSPLPAPAEPEEPTENAARAIVLRAFRAAVLGLIFFPLQWYSIWLLMRILGSGAVLQPAERRWFWLTMLLDVPIVMATFAVLWMIP